LRRCIIANIRRRQHIAGGSTHSFNLLDEELSKLVGVDVS